MPFLEMMQDKRLLLRGEPIFQGENLADELVLLLPERYGSHTLEEFDVSLCLFGGGKGNRAMMTFGGRGDGGLIYRLPLDSSLTRKARKLTLWAVLTNARDGAVIKSGKVTLRVEGRQSVSDALEAAELGLLDQWQMRMSLVCEEAEGFSKQAASGATEAEESAEICRRKAKEAADSAAYAANAERERTMAENYRENNERVREQQERERAENERARAEAETMRSEREELRELAEQQRERNEVDRIMRDTVRDERLDDLARDVASLTERLPSAAAEGNLLVGDGKGNVIDSGCSLRTIRPRIASWADVQAIVRKGLAAEVFRPGDRFACERCGYTLTWEVIGIDQDVPVGEGLTHSLTLQLAGCFASYMQFDGKEALYCCEEGLDPGRYVFTVNPPDACNGEGGKPYTVELNNRVEPMGVLVFRWPAGKHTLDCTVETYHDRTMTDVCETGLSVEEGSDGILLDGVNTSHRIRCGSENWEKSALRQWLNSDAYMGNVWEPSGRMDLPPNWRDTHTGFLYGMDEDFLSVVGKVRKTTAVPETDGGGFCELEELFFLPSLDEVGGRKESGGEGEPYALYGKEASPSAATARVKYLGDSSVSVSYFLRSADASMPSYLCAINSVGGVTRCAASNRAGVAPICNIV